MVASLLHFPAAAHGCYHLSTMVAAPAALFDPHMAAIFFDIGSHIIGNIPNIDEEGVNITANAVHPGLIMTNLFKHSAILMRTLKFLSFFLWKNVPQGAATTCYVALHPSLKGVAGKYHVDCNGLEPSAFARDEALARKLWDFSNNLITSVSKA